MGSSESKPEFPTEEAWEQWQESTNAKIEERLSKTYVQYKMDLTDEVVKFPRLLDRYFEECHDKSKLRRFLNNNTECTRARAELYGMITTLAINTAAAIEVRDAMAKADLLRKNRA